MQRLVRRSGHPPPSFDDIGSLKSDLPLEIAVARDSVIENTAELQALMLGPVGYLQQQMRQVSFKISSVGNRCHRLTFQSITTFWPFTQSSGFTSFPTNEEVSYHQLSQKCGLSESLLKRLLRFAMTKHLFRETSAGLIAHTALSKYLAETPIMRAWVGVICDVSWPAATRVYTPTLGAKLYAD